LSRHKIFIIIIFSLLAVSLFFTKTSPFPSLSGKATSSCTENWYCSDWTVCKDVKQQRICVDLNSCGTASTKPPLSQSCQENTQTNNNPQSPSSTITCSDGIKNQGEENIDCGGPCASCSGKVSLFIFWMAIPIISIIIISLIVYLFMKKRKKETSSASLFSTDIKSNNNINDYIQKCLAEGKSKKEIESNLVSVGWDKETINNALNLSASKSTDDSDIGKYIKDSIKEGNNLDEIKKQLVSVGWPEDEVEKKIKKYRKLSILSQYHV